MKLSIITPYIVDMEASSSHTVVRNLKGAQANTSQQIVMALVESGLKKLCIRELELLMLFVPYVKGTSSRDGALQQFGHTQRRLELRL